MSALSAIYICLFTFCAFDVAGRSVLVGSVLPFFVSVQGQVRVYDSTLPQIEHFVSGARDERVTQSSWSRR